MSSENKSEPLTSWFATGDPRPQPKKIVKPRQERTVDKPIIAIEGNWVLLENGEVFLFKQLPLLLRTQPSSILVAGRFEPILKFLDSEFEDDPNWQFRISPVERVAWAPNRKRKAVIRDITIGYFGFKGKNKERGHYHYPLSPQTFIFGKAIGELRRGIPNEDASIIKLMGWAKEVRSFLVKHRLNLSPTSGGIAAQFLRDEKFYPSARRKVPKRINARAREYLPGNFYRLYGAKELRTYNAAYLDQTSAHHAAASKLEFPCANTLRARGRYNTLIDRSFARFGTKKFNELIAQPGLFYLAVETPTFFDKDFPLPNLEGKAGYRRGFFYSNEIPYLYELGVRIRHIIACWTSEKSETGLNRYAEWALAEIEQHPERAKPWLKPTLLATYGVLAARPKILEFGFKQAKDAETKQYPCGSGFITVQAKATKFPREPAMANVIHRGMIEAQTRLESLRFARKLAAEGHTILAIYADSIFVDSETALPLLPPLWRVQDYLTALKFQSATHFTSLQVSKQPGMPENWRNQPVPYMKRIPPRPNKRPGKPVPTT